MSTSAGRGPCSRSRFASGNGRGARDTQEGWVADGACPPVGCAIARRGDIDIDIDIDIASNQHFSGCTCTFADPRVCAAIIDRLTFAGNILETGTTSCRPAHARNGRAS